MKNWRKQLKQEFKIHFENCPDEFQFLETFIEGLLNQQREEMKRMIKKRIEIVDEEYKKVFPEDLYLWSERGFWLKAFSDVLKLKAIENLFTSSTKNSK